MSSFAEQMLGARERDREDPQGHAARPRRADRLRRDDGVGAVINTAKVAPGATVR